MNPDYDYCRALVRERDRERYISALFAPADKRGHLYALYAFDSELAHVPDAVREPMAGEIRFQWWRDVLAGGRSEEAKSNPVAAAFLDTIARCDLSAKALSEVADASRFDLMGEAMNTLDQLFSYLDSTDGAIMAAAQAILCAEGISTDTVPLAGRCYGLTRRLRSIARDVARGRIFVPLDLLARHEVHTASVLAGENSPGLREALLDLRAIAREQLNKVRMNKPPVEILPAQLQLALAPIYLAKMERSDYDPFRTDVSISALRAQYVLWRAAKSGTI